jgi:deoxyxylulose-5-phosphate synthase
MAQDIARKLEVEGIEAAVINARFSKPIDVVELFAGSVEVILTLEDHVHMRSLAAQLFRISVC